VQDARDYKWQDEPGTPGLMRKCGEIYDHSDSYNSWERYYKDIIQLQQ